jgi:uncharacterized protein (TIGR03437 family)
VGSSVTIKGTNFAGASVVWFNGTNASFTLNSGGQITAVVPIGAGTGPVSVITPGGLATSAGNFTVLEDRPSVQMAWFTNGNFNLLISGPPNGTYTVEGATNLANPQWAPLFTTNAPALPFTFTESIQDTAQKFYRVRQQ